MMNLASDEFPMPPAIIVPPDETTGLCPDGFTKQADGSCKKDSTWIPGISNTVVMIAGGAILFLLLMKRK